MVKSVMTVTAFTDSAITARTAKQTRIFRRRGQDIEMTLAKDYDYSFKALGQLKHLQRVDIRIDIYTDNNIKFLTLEQTDSGDSLKRAKMLNIASCAVWTVLDI